MPETMIRNLQTQMQIEAALSLIVLAVLYGIGMWLLYLVIKAAIRDGIRESGLVQAWRNTANATAVRKSSADLPEMRAER